MMSFIELHKYCSCCWPCKKKSKKKRLPVKTLQVKKTWIFWLHKSMEAWILKTFFSLFHFSILSMSPCFPVPLSFPFVESLSFFYLTLAIYHYINSEQVAMRRKGMDGSSMCTALRNRWWSGDSELLWYECWVVSVRPANWTMMKS